MKNLLKTGDQRYVFTDAPEGDVIEIKLAYHKGGYNSFHYKNEQRGLYIYITPVHLERRNGYLVRSQTLLGNITSSGGKIFVHPMGRFSVKQLETVAREIDEFVPQWVERWRQNPQAVFEMIREKYPVA